MAFNPLQNFMQGQQFADQQKVRDLQNALSGQVGQAGFNPSQSLELQQLTALDPNAGARSLAVFQQLDNSRQKAFFQDAREGRRLLESGDGEGFLNLSSQRLSAVEKLGGDPSDIMSVLQSFNAGDIQGTIDQLRQAEQAGIEEGFLKDLSSDKGNKPKKEFEKQAQFEQLQELKRSGTPEQIKEYRALIGLDKPVKLSGTSEKALNTAQESAFSAEQAVNKMELLAKDISKTDIGGGVKAGWSETLKNLLGSQDEVSNLRREFRSIRSSQAVRNLPPGVASDKDIALALSGFPREDAPASEIISFLNGQAKLAKVEAAFNNFKSDYISTTKGISGFGKAWREQLKDEDYLSNMVTVDQAQLTPQKQNTIGRFQVEVQ